MSGPTLRMTSTESNQLHFSNTGHHIRCNTTLVVFFSSYFEIGVCSDQSYQIATAFWLDACLSGWISSPFGTERQLHFSRECPSKWQWFFFSSLLLSVLPRPCLRQRANKLWLHFFDHFRLGGAFNSACHRG
jgi:hypothetical protein